MAPQRGYDPPTAVRQTAMIASSPLGHGLARRSRTFSLRLRTAAPSPLGYGEQRWQVGQDLNPRRLFWRQACCRYTTDLDWSRRLDSNQRSPHSKCGMLTCYTTPRDSLRARRREARPAGKMRPGRRAPTRRESLWRKRRELNAQGLRSVVFKTTAVARRLALPWRGISGLHARVACATACR